MITTYNNKKISGILVVLPENEYSFEDTIIADNLKRVRRLKRIMGFGNRRCVKANTSISDMYIFGIQYLLDNRLINKSEIGAIVTVSLTPDYLAPTISNIVHGKLAFDEEVICVDIAQGCSGYLVGLMESFALLNHMQDKKVLLCTGDIFNRKLGEDVKTEEPVFGGDAASVSVIENAEDFSEIYYNFYSRGSKNLIMPAGAFSHPVYTYEDIEVELEDGRKGNGLGIWMDGSNVFNFIMKEVPPLLTELVNYSGKTLDELDAFYFHQPNRYILEKLADHMGIPREKMPMNVVEKYGNSNASTIPVAIADNVAEKMMGEKRYCCLSGFGSGLTWAGMILEMGEMDFCKIISSEL